MPCNKTEWHHQSFYVRPLKLNSMVVINLQLMWWWGWYNYRRLNGIPRYVPRVLFFLVTSSLGLWVGHHQEAELLPLWYYLTIVPQYPRHIGGSLEGGELKFSRYAPHKSLWNLVSGIWPVCDTWINGFCLNMGWVYLISVCQLLRYGNVWFCKKYLLGPLTHFYIWRLSLQLGCGDCCKIWTW